MVQRRPPTPVLLDGDGTVRTLGEQENDVLLGVAPGSRRSQSEATLVPRATVLLYTDGLVERRDRRLDHGIDLLVATVRDVASSGVDVDTLCDEIVARMLPEHLGDDVALIAVRLHP